MRCLSVLFVVGVLFFAPAMTLAKAPAGTFSVHAGVGRILVDDDLDLDNNLFYSLGLGYQLTQRWGVELTAGYVPTEVDSTDDDADLFLYRADLLYHLPLFDDVVPYLAAGAGGLYADAEAGESDHDLLVNYGGGIKLFTLQHLALRGDVRHLMSFDSGVDHHLLATLGLEWVFGGTSKTTTANVPIQAVETLASPITTAPQVSAVPAPLDSDQDGVDDLQDKCPDTPAGISVDENGCASKLTLQLEFDFDSADLRQAHRQQLAEAAVFIRRNPSQQVVIIGHTDDVGTEAYNQQLSLRRAEAVRNAMVDSYQIDASLLRVQGAGEQQPVATNATEAGRQQNRRVVIFCCDQKERTL